MAKNSLEEQIRERVRNLSDTEVIVYACGTTVELNPAAIEEAKKEVDRRGLSLPAGPVGLVHGALPNFLDRYSLDYFESNGLCFLIMSGEVEGKWCISVFFQNRYSGQCECSISLEPSYRSFTLSRIPLEMPRISVYCKGGDYGVIRAFQGVPHRYQGRRLEFELSANTEYPNGRGTELGLWRGRHVEPPSNLADDMANSVISLVPFMRFFRRKATKVPISVPNDVTEVIAELEAEPTQEILWSPDPILIERE